MGDLQPYQEDAVDVLPGDTIMWFGKYEGRNWTISDIEEHDGRYARWLIDQPWQNCIDFKSLRESYLASLDEHDCPLLTTKVWFGDIHTYKGKDFLSTYFDKRRWQWLLETQDHLKSSLLDLEQRYLNWQARNPEEDRDIQQAYVSSLAYRDHNRLDQFNPMHDGLGLKHEAYEDDTLFEPHELASPQLPSAQHSNRVIKDFPSRGSSASPIVRSLSAQVASFAQAERKITAKRDRRDEDSNIEPSAPPRKRGRISPGAPADEQDTSSERPSTPLKVEEAPQLNANIGLQTPPQTEQREFGRPSSWSQEPKTPSRAPNQPN